MTDIMPDSFLLHPSSFYYTKSSNTLSLNSGHSEQTWSLSTSSLILFPDSSSKFYIKNYLNKYLIHICKREYFYIWDLSSNTCIKELECLKGSLSCIELVESYLIFPTSSNEIQVFDLTSLTTYMTIPGHTSKIKRLLYKNHKVLSLSAEFLLTEFLFTDLTTHLTTILKDKYIKSFIHSPDFHYIALLTRKSSSKIWNLSTKTPIIDLYSHETDSIQSSSTFLAFSHFEASLNNWNRAKKRNPTIEVFNLETSSSELGIFFKQPSKFLIQNETLFYETNENCFQQWKLRTNRVWAEDLSMTACFQLEQNFYIGTDSGFLYIFNTVTGQEVLEREAHGGDVLSIQYQSGFIVSGSIDGTVRISEPQSLEFVSGFIASCLSGFCCTGKEIIIISEYGDVQYWSFPACEEISVFNHNGFKFTGIQICDSTLLVTCKNKGLFYGQIFTDLKPLSVFQDIELMCIALSDQYTALGCWNGKILYWRNSEVNEQLSYLQITGNSESVTRIQFDFESKFIMYTTTGDLCRVWSIDRKRNVFSFETRCAGFVMGGKNLKCVFSGLFSLNGKIKELEIVDKDMNVLSKKAVLLLRYRRKFRIV